MTKRSVFIGFGVCALAGLIGAPAARADRDMGGAPAVCVPQDGFENQFVTYTNGTASNIATTYDVDIICGSLRLNQSAPAGIVVAYNDATPTDLVSCTASVTSWGGIPYWTQSQSSSVQGTNPSGTFLFQPPQTATGYVVVDCYVPRMSSGHASGVRGISLQ